MKLLVAAFYRFVSLPDCREIKAKLAPYCEKKQVKGTILLATEGINGTIAGEEVAVREVLSWLEGDNRLQGMEFKYAWVVQPPFQRLKVKVKKEILTLGIPQADPTQNTGIAVSPQQWNQLINNPEVIVIDTRNQYEVEMGSFPKAIDPHTRFFREFPEYVRNHLDPNKHKKVAMFCTGGIRCEKASALMLSMGFSEVYQLQGGILKYLEVVPKEENMWQGECFVFDERVAVQHGLVPLEGQSESISNGH